MRALWLTCAASVGGAALPLTHRPLLACASALVYATLTYPAMRAPALRLRKL